MLLACLSAILCNCFVSATENIFTKQNTGGGGTLTNPQPRREKSDSMIGNWSACEPNCTGRSPEAVLKSSLLYYSGYDKTSRPVTNDSDRIIVRIGLSLFHILDTNERYQTITVLISVRLNWHDQLLRWNPDDFANVTRFWVPADDIWKPDIVINNNADHEVHLPTNAIVRNDGAVLWMYPQLAKIYCTLNVRLFPFDKQKCDLKFLSWTYPGDKVDLWPTDKLNLDIPASFTEEAEATNYFVEENQEWSVLGIRGKRFAEKYACCPEPFPDVRYTLNLQRRSRFYVFNMIFPCILIYGVAFLGFFLPIESNEKINLEVTILLALVVFLMVIAETMPPSPDSVPLLGMLYATTMLMVSFGLVAAVIVTNLYCKELNGPPIPRWVCLLVFMRSNPPVSQTNGAVHSDHEPTRLRDSVEILADTRFRSVPLLESGDDVKRSRPANKSDLPPVTWNLVAQRMDAVLFWCFTVASCVVFYFVFKDVDISQVEIF